MNGAALDMLLRDVVGPPEINEPDHDIQIEVMRDMIEEMTHKRDFKPGDVVMTNGLSYYKKGYKPLVVLEVIDPPVKIYSDATQPHMCEIYDIRALQWHNEGAYVAYLFPSWGLEPWDAEKAKENKKREG